MPHHTEAARKRPSDKVKAATAAGTGAAGLSVALATLVLWLFQHYTEVTVPEPIAATVPVILTAVLTLAATFLAGYHTVERHPSPSAVHTVHTKGLK